MSQSGRGMMLLLSLVMLLAVFAGSAQAYDVSGFVNYTGSKTGQIVLQLPTNNGMRGTVVSGKGPFTIRGVDNSGTSPYSVYAYMDTQGTGVNHYYDPSGSSASFPVSSANVAGIGINLTAPLATPPLQAPTQFKVFPGPGGVLAMWSQPSIGMAELADSYTLYWGNSPNPGVGTALGSKAGIKSVGNNRVVFITGLVDTNLLYFAVTATLNGIEGPAALTSTPITIGTPAGGSTVSGTVDLTGAGSGTAPLYVALCADTQNGPPVLCYVAAVSSVSYPTTQVFSIGGVQNGTYQVYPILDVNNNGQMDIGDLKRADNAAPPVVVSGTAVSAGTIALTNANAHLITRASHWQNGTSVGYGVNFSLSNNVKNPIAFTLTGGTGLTYSPIDFVATYNDGLYGWVSTGTTPPSGSYLLTVTYSDGTTENLTGTVTGSPVNFATPISPAGLQTYTDGKPVFTWTAPANPPTNYTYQLEVTAVDNSSKWYSSTIPRSQTSAVYNFDNMASPAILPSTYTGDYKWSIRVVDSATGNSSNNDVYFHYGTTSTPTTSIGNAGGTYTYNTNVLTLNWANSTFSCGGPTIGTETATVSVLSATNMTWVWGDGTTDSFTRSSGTVGDITGTWTHSMGPLNITFNANGTIALAGTANCSGTTTGPWVVYNVNPARTSDMDWLKTQHAALAYGNYIKLNGTYYFAMGIGGAASYWNDPTLYRGDRFVQCDQTTGAMLMDTVTTSMPRFADLSGVTPGTLIEGFTTWPLGSSSVPTVFSFTSAVQDCSTATCVNLQGVTVTTVGLSPEISTTSDANGIFSIFPPVTTTLTTTTGLSPATAPFHLVFSAVSHANSATAQMQLTASGNFSDRPYALYPLSKLTGWGNSSATGLIRSRIVDSAIPVTGYIAGAVVTATTTTGSPLPVEYVDPISGLPVSSASTGSNGSYIVRNIPVGTVVNVTATAPGYSSFQQKTFTIYADTVSQGRISGASSGSITFSGGVQDCSTSICTDLQGVTVTTVGLLIELTTTSDASGIFNFNIPTSSISAGVPATPSFHVVFSKSGLNNSASSQMQFTSSYNASDRPYALFPSAKLSAWGITAGNGVIRSRIVDSANQLTGYIGGATVTASTITGPLTVEYVDAAGNIVSSGTTDAANGMYIVRNIPAGSQVEINATAPNYTNFQIKKFQVYADTVSQGRTTGVLSGTSDTTPPSVPTSVTASPVSTNQINVSWAASTDNVGVTQYKIYRNPVLTSQPASVTSLSWSDYTVAANTTYTYSVAACDAANNCSAQSTPPASATTSTGTTAGPVTITGTITYAGTKTGRAYVFIQTNNGSLGTSVAWPSGTTSVPYTIRGVPSNNLSNTINAFIDISDKGVQSASSPTGNTTGSTNVKNITLSDPTSVAPTAPTLIEVKPGPSSVFIMWQNNEVNGVVDADSYDVYWSTSASVSSTNSTGSKLGVPVGMDSPLVITGLTDSSVLYFQVVAKRGSYQAASAVTGPITVGATVGLNTVSGTVTYNGTIPANTPLYVAVVAAGNNKGIGNLYYSVIASASISQAFSISGIPNGNYNVYAILDLNKDNMFAGGDATNTTGDQAPIIALTGNAGQAGITIALTSKNAEVVINTDHGMNVSGTPVWYNVEGRVSGQFKRPVTVTLSAKPTSSSLTVPLDLGFSKNNKNEFQFWNGNTSTPVVGDTYTFTITYSDGTFEDIIAAVTGVSNSFPFNAHVLNSTTIPVFDWAIPAIIPTGSYQYSLSVQNNATNNNMWEAWSIPSSQLQIVYGSGMTTSSAPLLQTTTPYKWYLTTRDQNGNRATVEGLYTPSTVAISDTTAPTIVSTSPTNNATGVSTAATISITFSEAVTGMPNINSSVKNNTTGAYISGTGTSSTDNLTHTFTPSSPLAPGTTYSIQFSTVTDMAGNALPATTLTFTTAGTVAATFTVTFNSNGGSTVSSQNVVANATATLPTAPTKTGFTFAGWYTDAALTSAFSFTTPITAITTLYAKWTAVVAPVTSAVPSNGLFNTPQSITLTTNKPGSTIKYTLDGSDPTTSTSAIIYSSPILVSVTTTIKFFAVDPANNVEAVKTVYIVLDTTAPVTTTSLAGGTYASAQNVTLTPSKPATVFYTLNGSTPTPASLVYSRPIVINTTTNLKFFSKDAAGNVEAVNTILYTIDLSAPAATATPAGGSYTAAQSVTLSASKPATIYYTLDGTLPTTASLQYSSPIVISSSTTLSFFAVDTGGNGGVANTAVYTIDTTAPAITSTVPVSGSVDVSPVGARFSITFTEAVKGMPSLAATLKNNTTGLYVPVSGSVSTDNKTHTFVPASPLVPGTPYSIELAAVTDLAGNILPATTLTFTTATATVKDTTPPLSSASVAGGMYSSVQTIVLSATEVANIYYTLDGTVPTVNSAVYSAPLSISATTKLKFFAVDTAGNAEIDVNSVQYIIVPSGDMNGDGIVDIKDAYKILEIVVGRIDATSADKKNADVAPLVNGIPTPDGTIGIGDVVVILRKIVGSVNW
jgi:uncharacterized repeat protein (TIGR02543 family)